MRKTIAAGLTATSLTFGGVGLATAETVSAPLAQETESNDNGDNGLWGLAGLAGLLGLASLAKRDNKAHRDTSITTNPR